MTNTELWLRHTEGQFAVCLCWSLWGPCTETWQLTHPLRVNMWAAAPGQDGKKLFLSFSVPHQIIFFSFFQALTPYSILRQWIHYVGGLCGNWVCNLSAPGAAQAGRGSLGLTNTQILRVPVSREEFWAHILQWAVGVWQLAAGWEMGGEKQPQMAKTHAEGRGKGQHY